jgi:hypothetical protein
MRITKWTSVVACAGLFLNASCCLGQSGPGRGHALPAFSEEREVAALHFARKHVPDLLPLLEKLKSADQQKYQTEICELFQTCEWLTDLRRDDDKRYAIELDIWRTETKSYILVARLAGLPEEEREKHKAELQDWAKKLVDLEMQIMRHRVDALEKELTELREALAGAEGQKEQIIKERYDKLFEEAKRRGGMK